MSKQKLEQTLKDRGEAYGAFDEFASVCQQLKDVVREADRNSRNQMTPAQREAMDMILHKVTRIAVGDPDHEDSWHDIAGYASLAEKVIQDLFVEEEFYRDLSKPLPGEPPMTVNPPQPFEDR